MLFLPVMFDDGSVVAACADVTSASTEMVLNGKSLLLLKSTAEAAAFVFLMIVDAVLLTDISPSPLLGKPTMETRKLSRRPLILCYVIKVVVKSRNRKNIKCSLYPLKL